MNGVRGPKTFNLWRLPLTALLGSALAALPSGGAETDVRRDATVAVVEKVLPSVVNIATETIVEYNDPFEQMLREFWGPYYRRRAPNTQYSLGSGVIIDENGYVLTNLHVVRRANKVWVKLADGREFEAEPTIVVNPRIDVALLKLKAKEGTKFQAVKFARDDDLMLGETVLALGNPFGLGGSVSRGILSSKNRRPPVEGESLDVADWLQTDAAINPGSSGGPLINLAGDLIGLNVAIYREGHGIGFAVPIKQVTEALTEIFVPEVTQSMWFGARIKSGPYPLRITAVEPGSPAEKAGLQKGDVIAQINGKTPRDFIQGAEWLSAGAKQEVTLAIQRNGARRTVTARMVPLADLIHQRLGISAQELSGELANNFGFQPRQGLLIAGIDPDGPAARAELRPGDLIAGIDGQATPDFVSAAGLLAPKKKGDRAELNVLAHRRSPFGRVTNQGSFTVRVR
jgi:serine protease Do